MQHRIFTLIILIMGAAITAPAQVPSTEQKDVVFFNRAVGMGVHGVPGAPDDALPQVRAALNLSEIQIAAVKALLNMRAQTTKLILDEMTAAQVKLQELAAQSNPNATDVGAAFLATQSVQTKFQAASAKFQTDFQALLNADQRSTLASLKAASAQIEALRQLGVLDGPFAGIPMSFTEALPVGGAKFERTIRIQR